MLMVTSIFQHNRYVFTPGPSTDKSSPSLQRIHKLPTAKIYLSIIQSLEIGNKHLILLYKQFILIEIFTCFTICF